VTRSKLGLEYFEQHPLGDYVWSRTYYLVNAGWNFVPHNFVVQLLVTQGAIASGLYFAIMGVTLLIAWKNRSDRLSALMAAYLVFYLTFCLFNPNIDNRENVALFCISVALVLHANRDRTPLEDSARQPRVSCLESAMTKEAATVRSTQDVASAQQASDCSPASPSRREVGTG
jgi:O-antigen ligase